MFYFENVWPGNLGSVLYFSKISPAGKKEQIFAIFSSVDASGQKFSNTFKNTSAKFEQFCKDSIKLWSFKGLM